uniref:Myosin-IB n=1 Tax=Timema bartmani TaxID=61472 RepID=A0A7R9EWJ9_9NEOP|nr:unnamed protein product [Timema bartmani]
MVNCSFSDPPVSEGGISQSWGDLRLTELHSGLLVNFTLGGLAIAAMLRLKAFTCPLHSRVKDCDCLINRHSPLYLCDGHGDSRIAGGQGAMERDLHARDVVGVQDFVLLENYQSEEAFVDNLKKRFKANLIYTYIGQVLVSVNPYRNLNIYTTETIKEYQKVLFYEAPPHVFALTDIAYRSLIEENREQCILISGESGSGKTEASKKVLQFIAEAAGNNDRVVTVKNKLLKSNPVLEAFGNAKTNRNDNSSRFGKYMDIEFQFTKSRVVQQFTGERNFHIFYQLLAGADDASLSKLHLKRNLDTYFYLTNADKDNAISVNDKQDFLEVKEALNTIGLTEQEQENLFAIVASVLHMGNVGFIEDEGKSELLGCDYRQLSEAFTHRTIEAHGDVVTTPLNRELAIYARDALAKAVYDRLFTWLVRRLNDSLKPQTARKNAVMGILDIYGFEIFERNGYVKNNNVYVIGHKPFSSSFEQFCINFCNEKLQQLFIELTLKSEQEEYLREGIEWEPVEYFNNKVICDLIEEKHKGIISLLDEECLRPGDATDLTFLEKINEKLTYHQHYISHRKADIKTQKIMGRDEFQLIHYAGNVTYNVKGFLDKNNDLLFRDLREAMTKTKNSITQEIFPVSELNSKKRPETAITQFRDSLNNLMSILMDKEPSYIRCIKPNDFKMAGQFDDKIVTHQVKYLGLMENLRVRRAGFAYRRPYELFLNRYKCLSPVTWPNFRGPAKEGVQAIVSHLGYDKDEYRMGKTKIFIRFPKTLFTTEDAFQAKKHDIAAIIQSHWKGLMQRRRYKKMKESAVIIQKWIRRFLAQRLAEKRRKAAIVIRRFINGFITRNGPETEENRAFMELAKAQYLMRLSRSLPQKLLDNSWPPYPHVCKEASYHLQRMHKRWQARKYRKALAPEKKIQFELKILAESMFKDKKKSYEKSVGPFFIDDRLNEEQKPLRQSFEVNNLQSGEKILYASSVIKYDRHGYKPRERALLLTNKRVYLLEGKTFKIKHNLPLEYVLELVLTTESDNLLLLRIPPDMKKDKVTNTLLINFITSALGVIFTQHQDNLVCQ